jgi:hypothetical protein
MARTRTNSDSAAQAREAAAAAQLPLDDQSAAYFENAIQASQAMLRGMAALQSEMLAFANARLREGLEASGSLIECRGDARQAVNLQLDFARRATEQYLDEAGKLMAIAAQMTRECWAPVEEKSRESIHPSATV